MRGIQLGPNHPDYGKPLDGLPPLLPKAQHRPKPGRPPKALPTIAMPPTYAEPRGVTQLLLAYSAEHAHRIGRRCDCPLCTYLGTLIDRARAERKAVANGR